MCTPTAKNLVIYFQQVIPTISPDHHDNRIVFATTSAMPSYLPLKRIWNFVFNGFFAGESCVITFDATQLIRECVFDISFQGDIYGLLTFKKKAFQLQKYVQKEILKIDDITYAIQFQITKPYCYRNVPSIPVYFNIILNDTVILE